MKCARISANQANDESGTAGLAGRTNSLPGEQYKDRQALWYKWNQRIVDWKPNCIFSELNF
ncbi:MAG: hypothetical protein AB9891_08990 [Anaerolineaceae bacterium]